MRILASAAVAAVLVAAAPQMAAAQDAATSFKRDKHVSVRQRPRPDYEAAGVRLGAFKAYPRLTVEAERDDNIYAVAAGETSDTIWRVKPELALRSDWSRHAVGAFASASVNRYSNHDTENNEEYTLGVNGRLDVVRGSNISGSLQYQQLIEPRSAPESLATALAPIEYSLLTANLKGVKEFNRLRITGDLTSKAYDYKDGRLAVTGGGTTVLDQDFRDRDQVRYGVKADYAVSPDTAFYVALAGDSRRYDVTKTRDSDGYNLTAGVDFELAQAIRGQVDAGYMKQTYDNFAGGSRDVSGFSTKSKVEWFPTELTTVTLNASRNIEEAVVAASQGYVSTNSSVAVDHELLRNVLLSGQASFGKDDYDGIDRADKRTGGKLSAAYLMNRRVGVFLTYTYAKTKSDGVDKSKSFTDNKLAASVALQF